MEITNVLLYVYKILKYFLKKNIVIIYTHTYTYINKKRESEMVYI